MAWICRQTHVTCLQMLNIDGQGQQSKLKFKFYHFIKTRDVFHTAITFMLFFPSYKSNKKPSNNKIALLKTVFQKMYNLLVLQCEILLLKAPQLLKL